MQKILCLIFVAINLLANAQTFTRRTFDYTTLEKNSAGCNQEMLHKLNDALIAISQNNSGQAVTVSKSIYDNDKSCPDIYEVYGESLFRNGQLLEGIGVIEDGIDKFGSNTGLIQRRYEMSIELYEVGIGRKNVDGNAVYNAGKKLPYDEAQFKVENLKSAQRDLEYLNQKFPDSLAQAYTLGRILTINGEPAKARAIFEKLKNDNQYYYGAGINIADIFIADKNYDLAIAELEPLTVAYPKGHHAYRKLSEVYKLRGDNDKTEEFVKKAVYYEYVPDFTDLAYSSTNYDLLALFADEQRDEKDKFAKLDEIAKTGNIGITTDVCLLILKLHANHGNGLEEEAVKKLIAIGKPAITKVNWMFSDNISTCTVSGLAEIMAAVKDKSSWQVLADYLPYMATMPMTIIPPDVPTQIIRYDNERGTKEVLKVVRGLIEKEKNEEELPFSAYTFYGALANVKQKEMLKMAREIGYTDAEITMLKSKTKE
jgi:tetratricopeptide (TPR) repeat protein